MIYYLERLDWELFSRDGNAKSCQVAQVRDALALYTGDDKDGWLRGQSLRQANDECYVTEIVEFTGCAADGDTPEEALRSLRELKEVWMRAVVENGYAVPAPRHAAGARERRLAAA